MRKWLETMEEVASVCNCKQQRSSIKISAQVIYNAQALVECLSGVLKHSKKV